MCLDGVSRLHIRFNLRQHFHGLLKRLKITSTPLHFLPCAGAEYRVDCHHCYQYYFYHYCHYHNYHNYTVIITLFPFFFFLP